MAVAAGDVQAAARLHQANQRLVRSVARRYEAGAATVPFEALVRAGDFGLEMALERFDVSKQFRFSTYAVWWIRQQITRVIAERGRGTGA